MASIASIAGTARASPLVLTGMGKRQRFTRPSESFYLYYPNRAQMPGKLRALFQFMQAVNWTEPP
ncbi:hypothetical protein [Ottowia thiooxydans]|uniref:hypothetical protein n=1 Tax=Ottowia thiooxydans TaxID=219182 RepID=UPI001B7FEA83|nr:hypothetical protein [Ottowia thiooxydans]